LTRLEDEARPVTAGCTSKFDGYRMRARIGGGHISHWRVQENGRSSPKPVLTFSSVEEFHNRFGPHL